MRPSRSRFLALCASLTLGLIHLPAQARLADEKEFSQAWEFYHSVTRVEADAKSTMEDETQVRLLNQGATEGLTHFQTTYDPLMAPMKVLEAKTINGKEEIPVPPENIEDKAVASDGASGGFQERRQVAISYPALKVGSRLYRKIRTDSVHLPVPGFFSSSAELSGLIEKASYTYRSKIPLYLEVQDPDGYFEVTRRDRGPKADYRYEIVIRLKRKLVLSWMDEQFALMPEKKMPRYFVSSHDNWKSAYAPYAEQWAAHFAREIPESKRLESFEPIRQAIAKASRAKGTLDKINAITQEINQIVRYAGDWRSTEKGLLPRPLAEVMARKGGDCKDFTSLTVIALRAMGIEAQPALVSRGTWGAIVPEKIPAWMFNHAITVAFVDGREIWIDSTNFTSFAHGKRADIENRAAMILDPAHPRLGRIPPIRPEDGTFKYHRVYKLTPRSPIVEVKGMMSLTGTAADGWTGYELKYAKSGVEDALAREIFDVSKVISAQVEPFDLSSRITSDLKFAAKAQIRTPVRRTTAGYAFPVAPAAEAERFADVSEDRLADLELWRVRDSESTTVLEGVKLVGGLAFACEVKSPWYDGWLKIQQDSPDKVSVVVGWSVKTLRIRIEELRGSQFKKFQQDFQDCLGGTSVVFNYVGEPVEVTLTPPKTSANPPANPS